MEHFQRLPLKETIFIAVLLVLSSCSEPSSHPNEEYKTKTKLVFPVLGESFIAAGGRLKSQNPFHYQAPDQRYALDIIALKPGSDRPDMNNFVMRALNGKFPIYEGDFYQPESHFCFGMTIVAPGDGVVIAAVDGIRDNRVGQVNTQQMAGNHVVIDHLNGEFSMLAHFRKGSVQVQTEQVITAGTPIGECGNSGNSSLPHLHYHLQDTPKWLQGMGLPMQFYQYKSDGGAVDIGEPYQGQIIISPAD